MFTTDQLKTIVLQGHILNEQEFDRFTADASREQRSLEELLISKKAISEEQLYSIAATVLSIPFVDLRSMTIADEVLALIPETLVTTHHIVAYEQTDGALTVASTHLLDATTLETLNNELKTTVRTALTSPASMRAALKQYHRAVKLTRTGTSDTHPAVQHVEALLAQAIADGASDIHIEPTNQDVTARFRVDGLLRVVKRFTKEELAGIVARIKVLAHLKVDEHRLPQDGRFMLASPSGTLSVRVSTIPVMDGENIVMRLLDESAEGAHSLDDLGLSGDAKHFVERAIKKPHGILLVTGPTGSGKTTTLYTILRLLNKPEVNIVTIEDPIEYRVLGINQTQVNPTIGLTFATGLRSFLRQDPDIIMVGEIRDEETAAVSIHASLTGHLVLSTLHTNDAVTTLARLVDMKIQPYLLAQTLSIVIAQRLVRTICPACVTSYSMDEETIAGIERLINPAVLRTQLVRAGALSSPDQSLSSLRLYRGKGCSACGTTGYKGRAGIYEVLPISQALADQISKNAGRDELRAQAERDGLVTLMTDGLLKAFRGITTIEEVLRVTASD